jgi:hypothetical protein
MSMNLHWRWAHPLRLWILKILLAFPMLAFDICLHLRKEWPMPSGQTDGKTTAMAQSKHPREISSTK